MHGQRLMLSRDGEQVFVQLARQAAPQVAFDAALAGACWQRPDCAWQAARASPRSAARSCYWKWRTPPPCIGLQPDLALIQAWGKAHGVSGCYAWCRLGDNEMEGRNFNHLDPLLEDSATGVAAGALTALLGHGLLLRQGRARGSDCIIRTALEGDAVLVGGRVRNEPTVTPAHAR